MAKVQWYKGTKSAITASLNPSEADLLLATDTNQIGFVDSAGNKIFGCSTVTSSATSFAVVAKNEYRVVTGTPTTLRISSYTAGTGESIIKFVCGSASFSLSYPTTIKRVGNLPTWTENKTYYLFIWNGIMMIGAQE